ncbi:MAG: nucleotidyl transferase AbiEii/AbiGii toxin family protein [Burkholderiaceae bacterium]|nr:nucleotidyl transferase AbiEii/AbiGii toxin family protein [Burkholderiaceae bacterium]
MSTHVVEEIDIPAWVGKAEGADRVFREAVHIVLAAISSSAVLQSTMVMKGGMLMAIRYHSSRFTRDADFSTRDRYREGNDAALFEELCAQIDLANETLGYDTMCRGQRYELKPKRADATYPTLTVNIGYAQRSRAGEVAKLQAGQATKIVAIDYSYNEAVFDVEILSLGDGDVIAVYSYINLLAEKYRSLLQQPVRNRYREQDVYDINLLLGREQTLQAEERAALLNLLITSCHERGIAAQRDSIANPDVRKMAETGYAELAAAVEGELLPFDDAYAAVQALYESLPWDGISDPDTPA